MDLAPILATAGPFLGYVHHCQIEHLSNRHRWGIRILPCNFPQLPVKVFNGIEVIRF